jgi:alpha-1,2-rhamnosyltransferase
MQKRASKKSPQNNKSQSMRALIECTYVYDHPHVNSGIQRVVRNIINELNKTPQSIECIPVIFKNNEIYRVSTLRPDKPDGFLLTRLWLENHLHNYWQRYARREKTWPFKWSKNLRCVLFVAQKLVSLAFLLPLWATKKLSFHFVDDSRAQPLTHHPDDILVLLDSSWHAEFFSVAERLKRDGVQIVSVIYDLIPITHPQFCDAGLVNVFKKWVEWVAQTADGFMAISDTISKEMHNNVISAIGVTAAHRRWFDHFYLGSELDQIDDQGWMRKSMIDVMRGQEPIYLMVSTIEPRKNHHYLLDAFEPLWAKGVAIKLCFVGRIGWKCDSLVERVENHSEYRKYLFMFNDLTDTELEFCYESAKALVFPSYVEGFGLPLVEAMQRGVPVMASDIPVFKEIGGDFIAYFDLENSASLTQLIITFEENGKLPVRDINEWQWINWGEAANMLVSKVLAHIEPQHVTKDLRDNAVTRANYY